MINIDCRIPQKIKSNFNNYQVKNLSNISFSGLNPHYDIDIFQYDFSTLHRKAHEYTFQGYITALSDKMFRNVIERCKSQSIEQFNSIFQDKKINVSLLNEVLSNGNIKNVQQLKNFLTIFNKTPKIKKVFNFQYIEAAEIYGKLGLKTDLAHFPSLLLNIYNEESEKDNPDYGKLNTFVNTLKEIGIEDESQIEEKLAHLKGEFNNFETTDKKDAAEYLAQTYNSKISQLNAIIESNPDLKRYDAKTIYKSIYDVIDYLYIKNDGKNLDNLQSYIDIAANFGKVKSNALSQAKNYFGDMETPEAKITFFETLKNCDVTINEFNELAKKHSVKDLDLLDILIYKSSVQEQIPKEKNNLYNNFYPILTAVYTKGDNQEDTDLLNTTLGIIDKYKLNNTASFISFYNKVCKSHEKNLSVQQVCEFSELFKYTNKNILELMAKEPNFDAVSYLKKAKEDYNTKQPYIETFLQNTDNEYFAGKTSVEIYTEYGQIVDFTSENLTQELNHLAAANDNDETKHRLNEFNRLLQFFDTKQDLLNFAIKNNIKFDNSEISNKYRDNCFKMLQILSQNCNEDEFKEKTEKLSQSGFLPKSQNNLDDLFSDYESSGELDDVVNIIIKTSVPSVREFNNFIHKYETGKGRHDNILKHLSNMPENIDFSSYTKIIDNLSRCIKNHNINIEINNDNILNIDTKDYMQDESEINVQLNKLLCSLLNKPEAKSFIEVLKSAYTNRNNSSPFQIAMEIANNVNKDESTYKNILRELKLDKQSLNLEESEITEVTYGKAIMDSLPREFTDFINSDKWINIHNDKTKIPNLSPHAKLRLLERFILTEDGSIKNLYSGETQDKLKQILKSIYTTTPQSIRGSVEEKRFKIQTAYNENTIKSIFAGDGRLITAYYLD